MNTPRMFSFEIALHPRPSAATPGPIHADHLGEWPTLTIPRDQIALPMPIDGDTCLARLDRLERMFTEQDGSFVWTSRREGLTWQVDGNIHERDGRVLLADLKGRCPEPDFDRLLSAFGWPEQPVMMQLVRQGVFLDDQVFRRHAAALFHAGAAEG